MRTVFFGTSSFAARVYQALAAAGCPIVAVVTRPDKPKGRSHTPTPPPVKEVVTDGTPLYQPVKASTPEFAAALAAHHPDLFVVVAYGEIIKTMLLDLPRLGCINVHASLLPKYRGADPIRRAIMNGEAETGITIMRMVLEMDAGDILKVVRVPIAPEMNFGQLDQQLSTVAIPALLEVIEELSSGRAISTPQDSAAATFASKIIPEEERIDWNQSAEKIHNQIRALAPKPGAWTILNSKRLKIFSSQVVEASAVGQTSDSWVVPCGKGALRLLEVQLEGKKRMDVGTFLRGAMTPLTFPQLK